jgi:hypothetical protein
MTSISTSPWHDVSPDFPVGSHPEGTLLGTVTVSFRDLLVSGFLIEAARDDAQAVLVVQTRVSLTGVWKLAAEVPLIRSGEGTAEVFASVVSMPQGGEVLRLDVLGGGFTAAVTSADGEVFSSRDAAGAGSPLLDAVSVAAGEGTVVALASRPGDDDLALWSPSDLAGAGWEKLAGQPGTASAGDGGGVVTFAGGRLVVAYRNPVRGFEIWSAPWTPGELAWTRVLEQGAWKWAANSDVFALTAFGGDCYAATGAGGTQINRLAPFHRRAFELLRLYPGGDWDLLVGTPVFTPGGIRVPLSAKGPGLDHLWNEGVLSLLVWQGALWLLGRDLDVLKLWRSTDGVSWDAVSLVDLPDLGVSSRAQLVATPLGLAIAGLVAAERGVVRPRLLLRAGL